jgi:hypothetical protein
VVTSDVFGRFVNGEIQLSLCLVTVMTAPAVGRQERIHDSRELLTEFPINIIGMQRISRNDETDHDSGETESWVACDVHLTSCGGVVSEWWWGGSE